MELMVKKVHNATTLMIIDQLWWLVRDLQERSQNPSTVRALKQVDLHLSLYTTLYGQSSHLYTQVR